MTHRRGFFSKSRRAGFTLLELLIVVTVLIALLALTMLSLTAIRKQLRQKELDSKAEIIYVAVQNRMTELRAAGYDSLYQYSAVMNNGVQKVGLVPRDADPDTELTPDTLCYVESAANGAVLTDAAGALLPEGMVDEELRSNQWHIEYDPASGSVYSVFYSATGAIPTNMSALDLLRVKKLRLDGGAVVGYYGGDISQIDSTDVLFPSIRIENKEQLKVTFYCNNPSADEKLTFSIALSDGEHTYKRTIQHEDLDRVTTRTYSYTWILDSLKSPSTRFYEQTEHQLTCGTTLNISLTVSSSDTHVDAARFSRDTNSLFDYREGTDADTALISYARHLQNLDEASHVSAGITHAVQISDISFRDDENNDEDWFSLYGDRFKPIENDNLCSYDGHSQINDTDLYTAIYALHIPNTEGTEAGLFRTFAGTLSNITLTGTRIDQGTAVGALAGWTDGDVTLENCRVFLSAKQGDLDGITAAESVQKVEPWLSGNIVGGLIGRSDAAVTIRNSFAASVLKGQERVGGLIGQADSAVDAEGVYADCYLLAPATGGLIGGVGTNAAVTLEDFYAVGYQAAAREAAGMVPGAVVSAKNGYSACDFISADGLTIYATAASGQASNVYYLSGGNALAGTQHLDYAELSKNGTEKLGSSFTAYSGDATYPYNLLGQGLSSYSYPRLTALDHYGDWQAEFESGALVYYEVYADGSYAFEGANASTLANDRVAVGDGYALAYTEEKKPGAAAQITVRYEDQSEYQFSAGQAREVTSGGETYYLVPLPKEVTNPKLNAAAEPFYQKITIADDSGEADYYYNPYFSKTVTVHDRAPGAPATVYIRTARQLYALSRYYPKYAFETAQSLFEQELDIDYTTYQWSVYSTESTSVAAQAPINSGDGFLASYNGGYHEIAGVSIVSATADTGLFGTINSSGTVRNLFLTGRGAQTITRSTDGGIAASGSRNSSQIGALVGVNNGTINNCAVSGYTMQYYGYSSNTVEIGGLAGRNNGTIRACSADAAGISLANTNSYAYAGGFVGCNGGSIFSSYATGRISVLDARNSTVWIAGFAADNAAGVLRRCYAATALTASGTAESYGFAHIGGAVVSCRYLDGGTYSYAGALYAYNTSTNEFAKQGLAAGTKITGAALQRLSLTDFEKASASYYHDETGSEGDSYPYPAVVRKGNRTVHYGNWPVLKDIGTLGVFYWEYEDYGSNSGYHFSYIGTAQGESIGTEDNDLLRGNSLCREHNDGGVITAYGYGYFYKKDESAPTLQAVNTNLGTVNENAGRALNAQMPDYLFVAYQTGEGGDALHTTGFTRDSTWTLRCGTATNPTAVYTYSVCPFFASAFSLDEIQLSGAQSTKTESATPGAEKNAYQIRSAKQLQFINWNSYHQTATHSISTDVAEDWGRTQYPYLTYSDPYNTNITNNPLTWKQSHDLDAYLEYGGVHLFTPIGSLYDYLPDNWKQLAPQAWRNKNSRLDIGWSNSYAAMFTSTYDGQAYTIKNIEIQSTMQCIGLFGVTSGATLEDIVLYSDRGSRIVNLPGGENWYCIGGLVGFAGSRSIPTSSFMNCSVSGYQIVDQRDKGNTMQWQQDNNENNTQNFNRHSPGWGGGCVGGLVGATNMDITRCTAVTDITLDIGYNLGYKNLRAGGIAGVCRGSVSACYAGGSIQSVSTPEHRSYTNGSSIWTGGLVGGIVLRADGNLGNLFGRVDGALSVENSYSYVSMPEEGSKLVKAAQSIAGNGEMQAWFSDVSNMAVLIRNCYCLAESASKTADYKAYGGTEQNWSSLNLNRGDTSGSWGRRIQLNNVSSPYLSYAEMSNGTLLAQLSTAGFSTVTTTEHGAAIPGKYSFPGNEAALSGLDYPFPTVLQQDDVFGGRVNVHYGAWPKFGIYWERTSASFDLYANRTETETGERLPLLKMKLRGYGTGLGALTADDIIFCDDEGEPVSEEERPLSVYAISALQRDAEGDYYEVTFQGLRAGRVFVRVEQNGKLAETVITVTSRLVLRTVGSEEIRLCPGEERQIELQLYYLNESGGEERLTLDEQIWSRLQWAVSVSSGSSIAPVLCDENSIRFDPETGLLTLHMEGNFISGAAAQDGQITLTCTYQYSDAENEKLTATADILTATRPADFAALYMQEQISGWRFAYSGAQNSSVNQSLPDQLQGDGLYLRGGYTAFGQIGYDSITLEIDGETYRLDENHEAYCEAVNDSGELQRIDGQTSVTLGDWTYDEDGNGYLPIRVETRQSSDVTLLLTLTYESQGGTGSQTVTLRATVPGAAAEAPDPVQPIDPAPDQELPADPEPVPGQDPGTGDENDENTGTDDNADSGFGGWTADEDSAGWEE